MTIRPILQKILKGDLHAGHVAKKKEEKEKGGRTGRPEEWRTDEGEKNQKGKIKRGMKVREKGEKEKEKKERN